MGVSFPLCSGIPHGEEKQHVADKGNNIKHGIKQKMPNAKHMAYDFISQQHSSIVSEVRHAATFEAG